MIAKHKVARVNDLQRAASWPFVILGVRGSRRAAWAVVFQPAALSPEHGRLLNSGMPGREPTVNLVRRTAFVRVSRSPAAVIIVALVFCTCALIGAPDLRAQDKDDWVGKRVMQKTRTIEIRPAEVPARPDMPPLPGGARSPFDQPPPPPVGARPPSDLPRPQLPVGARAPFDQPPPLDQPPPPPFGAGPPSDVSPPQAKHAGKLQKKSTRFPTIYFVIDKSDDMLWLSSEDKSVPSGWVPRGYVIPIEGAIEFFTKQIHANPQDAFALASRALLRGQQRL